MMNNYKMFLPHRKGYWAYYIDEKGKQKFIGDPTKSKASAIRRADNYMFENQVQTYITECLF